jgi:hypothetical protein
MQQQLSMPPAIMVQRLCSMAAETVSSHEQVTFMPPAHFAKVIVQRGIIIMFMAGAVGACVPIIPLGPDIGIPGIDMPGIGIPERSIIFAAAILVSSFAESSCCNLSQTIETRAL